MIKAILFDLDGTLIDTNELIIESYAHTLKKHFNMEVEREVIVRTFGEPLRHTMEGFSKGSTSVDELLDTYRSFNAKHHDDLAKEIKGVASGLRKLKEAGVKLAIVTSKRRNMAMRGLELMGLSHQMDAIITPEDTLKHKPLGDPALKACEILGVSPEEAIMVGDSHNDILCGRNAGCKTCLVKYTALNIDELLMHEPDYIIGSVEELADICKDDCKKTS